MAATINLFWTGEWTAVCHGHKKKNPSGQACLNAFEKCYKDLTYYYYRSREDRIQRKGSIATAAAQLGKLYNLMMTIEIRSTHILIHFES